MTPSAAAAAEQARLDLMADYLGCLEKLSARELEVLVLTSKGLSCAEIGEQISLSGFGVNDVRRRIFAKLGVHTAVEAAVIAAKAGVV